MVYSAYGRAMSATHPTCICEMIWYFNEKLWSLAPRRGGVGKFAENSPKIAKKKILAKFLKKFRSEILIICLGNMHLNV